MIKKTITIIVITVLAFVLSSCAGNGDAAVPGESLLNPSTPPAGSTIPLLVPEQAADESDDIDIIGDDEPISRALAARMSALLLNDRHSVAALEREILYEDSDVSQWFDAYINAVHLQNLMTGDGAEFRPHDNLNVGEAQAILNAINPDNPIRMRITDENRHMPISYALWAQLYERVINEFSESGISTGISERNLVILAGPSNNSQLPEGNVIADSGPFTGHGIDFSGFIDKEIRVLVKDGEILAVLGVVTDTPLIRGAYIVSVDDEYLVAFIGGAERSFNIGDFAAPMLLHGRIGPIGIGIANFILDDNRATNITINSLRFNDRVLLHDSTRIEFEEKGVMPLSPNFRVYSEESGTVHWRGPGRIIVGHDMARFYEENGVIIAAVIERRPSPETIRVVIMDSDFSQFTHERVEITSTSAFQAVENGALRTFAPGERFEPASPSAVTNRIFLSGDGLLTINSLSRSYGSPEYRGILEIIGTPDGFIIVNEVNIEEYLYSVLPSEMPASFGNEALKVQAITARSYAYNQFYANNFHRFGANVCDSVMSQVYNNMRESDASRRAVRETAGLCLTFGASVISANFFSTSAGVTANNGEVWAQRPGMNFPAETRPYLSSVRQYRDGDFGDLRIEENMFAFIMNREVRSYDSWSNFFRWSVEMTNEEISAAINANLRARYEAAPRLIQTLQSDGSFRARPVDSIGALLNIEVTQRGEAGNIMTMRITGTENTILVSTEFNIRSLLRPRQHVDGRAPIGLLLHTGEIRENLGLLPSAFFVMERMTDAEGNILFVRFSGGGNGHGVGMSQTGVRGMTDAGRTFEEVLAHFYPGTRVERRW